MSRFPFVACVLASFACWSGCDGPANAPTDAATQIDANEDLGPPRAIFVVPRTGAQAESFFDLPWPSDLRTGGGHIDVSGFPNPRGSNLLTQYLNAINARQRGFSTNGAVYFRFSRDVDVQTLPQDHAASVGPDASAFLIDVDEGPSRLSRHPATVHYQSSATVFWSSRTVAIRPINGVPLAGGRRYAAVITRGVGSTSEPFERDTDFEALLEGSDSELADARALYRPAIDAIVESGTALDSILAIAVFTTVDPVAELTPFRDWMHASYTEPTARDEEWRRTAMRTNHEAFVGHYGPVPIFQEGTIPYVTEGGAMELGGDGVPVVHSEYDARFSMTVPLAPMPEAGYPVVLYAHGTGGDYQTFVGDGTGGRLAELGIAMMGIDQIHHGDRNPTEVSPELLFFNVNNPEAARDNNRQSALDVVQQARLIEHLTIPMTVTDRGGAQIHFDPNRVYFYGHSQGGLVGPIFLGIDDGVSAAVLSAGSAVIAHAFLAKTLPFNIPDVVRVALGLPGDDTADAFARESFRIDHPVITLIQGWLDVSDGSNFGHLVLASPRDGFSPKSILATEGLMDEYAPPAAIEAMAISMHVPLVQPIARRVVEYDALDISPVAAPVQGNVAGGTATAGVLQYRMGDHFVAFESGPQTIIRTFFESLVRGEGPPTIEAPTP